MNLKELLLDIIDEFIALFVGAGLGLLIIYLIWG